MSNSIKFIEAKYEGSKLCENQFNRQIRHNGWVYMTITVDFSDYDLMFENFKAFDNNNYSMPTEKFVLEECAQFLRDIYELDEDLNNFDLAEFNENYGFDFNTDNINDIRIALYDAECDADCQFQHLLQEMNIGNINMN